MYRKYLVLLQGNSGSQELGWICVVYRVLGLATVGVGS